MNATMETAIAAADAGLAVIFQNGKCAVTPGWNKGPANSPEHLRKTYREGNNIAFRAGPTSRIEGDAVVVLDVDLRSGNEIHRAEARAAYAELVGPLKPTVATGGGGFHLYVRMPADKLPTAAATILRQSSERLASDDPNKPGKPCWTVELLAAEHAVTMPPSVHPSGIPYRWLNGGLAHVAMAPESLLRALAKPAERVSKIEAIRPGPSPLPDPLPPVPTFDPDWLPANIRAWCVDAAEGLQVPLDFTAIPALVALAGTVGRRVGIAMKRNDHWIERPILWGCVVGRPSSSKSPALNPARRMLERLAKEERQSFEVEQREHEARSMVADAARANAKDAIRKAMKAGDKLAAESLADAVLEGNDAPTEPRIVVNDATIEKLGELLNANPRGLVQFRDELAGWMANLDREGREGDRAFWLECWNGTGAYTVDRIGRGTIAIEACAVSLLGGMQPGKLAEYVRGAVRGGFADDGLIQRFQLAVFPDLPASWTYTDRAPNPQSELRAWATFQRLRALDPDNMGAESEPWADVPFLRFNDEAQELLIEWMTTLMRRLRGGEEPAWMESHLSKFRGLAGRLALVLHLVEGHSCRVSADTLATALNICDYLEGHARRIYAPATDNGLTAAHLILKRRADLGDTFTARDLYRRGWAGVTDADTAEAALDVLIEYGHLATAANDPGTAGGRPSIVYAWGTP